MGIPLDGGPGGRHGTALIVHPTAGVQPPGGTPGLGSASMDGADLDLAALREEYGRAGLDLPDLAADRSRCSRRWLRRRARPRGCTSPTRWCCQHGRRRRSRPSSGWCCSRASSRAGFVFFTNHGLPQGRRAGRQPALRAALPLAPARAPGPGRGRATPLPPRRSRPTSAPGPAVPSSAPGPRTSRRSTPSRAALQMPTRRSSSASTRSRSRSRRTGAATSSRPRPWSSGRAGRAGCTTGWSTGATAHGWVIDGSRRDAARRVGRGPARPRRDAAGDRPATTAARWGCPGRRRDAEDPRHAPGQERELVVPDGQRVLEADRRQQPADGQEHGAARADDDRSRTPPAGVRRRATRPGRPAPSPSSTNGEDDVRRPQAGLGPEDEPVATRTPDGQHREQQQRAQHDRAADRGRDVPRARAVRRDAHDHRQHGPAEPDQQQVARREEPRQHQPAPQQRGDRDGDHEPAVRPVRDRATGWRRCAPGRGRCGSGRAPGAAPGAHPSRATPSARHGPRAARRSARR